MQILPDALRGTSCSSRLLLPSQSYTPAPASANKPIRASTAIPSILSRSSTERIRVCAAPYLFIFPDSCADHEASVCCPWLHPNVCRSLWSVQRMLRDSWSRMYHPLASYGSPYQGTGQFICTSAPICCITFAPLYSHPSNPDRVNLIHNDIIIRHKSCTASISRGYESSVGKGVE
jgi:hypothetical protein